jgi:hypothetical protein
MFLSNNCTENTHLLHEEAITLEKITDVEVFSEVGKPSMTSKHFVTPWKAWTKKPKRNKHWNATSSSWLHARRALIKHFKVWMNNLWFLAMYGEDPTGRIVASRYLSPPLNTTAAITSGLNEMQVLESPIHNKRLIDLKKFASFFSN